MSIGLSMSPQKAKVMDQIVTEAARSKDLGASIQKYGQSLTAEEKKVLSSLSPAELGAIASINKKLAPLGLSALY